jgi:hypothetical protein
MTSPMDSPAPRRIVRQFSVDEFRDIGKPGLIGKVIKKFSKLSAHHGEKKFKIPQRGLKIVKSSDVPFKPSKVPYL